MKHAVQINWSVSFNWFVLFIWLTETNRINQMNQRDQMNQTNQTNQVNRTGLVPPTEVPSPGSKEPACRLCVMLVMVSQPAGAKTDQHDETSAEQDAGCRQYL